MLEEIARGEGRTLTELAAHLQLAKSTVSDVTAALVSQQLLRRDAHGRYWLGGHLESLAASLVSGGSGIERFGSECEASPVLQGRTVMLFALQGIDLVCVDARLGTQPLPRTPRAGSKVGLLDSCIGDTVRRSIPAGELRALLEDTARYDGLSPEKIEHVLQERDTASIDARDGMIMMAGVTEIVVAGRTDRGAWIAICALLPTRLAHEPEVARLRQTLNDVLTIVCREP